MSLAAQRYPYRHGADILLIAPFDESIVQAQHETLVDAQHEMLAEVPVNSAGVSEHSDSEGSI